MRRNRRQMQSKGASESPKVQCKQICRPFCARRRGILQDWFSDDENISFLHPNRKSTAATSFNFFFFSFLVNIFLIRLHYSFNENHFFALVFFFLSCFWLLLCDSYCLFFVALPTMVDKYIWPVVVCVCVRNFVYPQNQGSRKQIFLYSYSLMKIICFRMNFDIWSIFDMGNIG